MFYFFLISIDIAVFSPFAYLEANYSFPEYQVFASHKAYGKKDFTRVIVVDRNNRINTLRDKKFLFVKEGSTSGYEIPVNFFKEQSIDIKEDFSNITLMRLPCLKIIYEVSISYNAYVFRKSLMEEEKTTIEKAMFNAHKLKFETRFIFCN